VPHTSAPSLRESPRQVHCYKNFGNFLLVMWWEYVSIFYKRCVAERRLLHVI
jgi:hypothetical protein